MITYSAAGYWVDCLSGSTPTATAADKHLPDTEDATSATRHNYLRSAWTAIVCAPLFVMRQVARLVPASMKAAWTARAEALDLARNIKRLQDLGPHLLRDIGIEQAVADVYVVIGTGKPVTRARPTARAVIRTGGAPAKRPVKAAPQVAWRASARWTPDNLASAVMP